MDEQLYEIELLKLKLERSKMKWTAASIFVPLLAALATVAYGFWSTAKQAELAFQLEAAKSVMQVQSPSDAKARAKMLNAMFPQLLPETFSSSFNAASLPEDYYKFEFAKLVAGRGLTAPQTAELWRTLFANDVWAKVPTTSPKN
jgi:hypothetical protein